MTTYRRLYRSDAELLAAHLLRLDHDARYARFNAILSNAALQNYVAAIDWNKARIIGCFDAGVLRAVAEIRFGRMLLPQEAELAFSVEGTHQNHRIGTSLMARALLHLRNRGVRTAHIVCLLANSRMIRLAMRHRANVQARSGEVFMTVEVPQGDAGSLLTELTDQYFFWINRHIGVAAQVQNAGASMNGIMLDALSRESPFRVFYGQAR